MGFGRVRDRPSPTLSVRLSAQVGDSPDVSTKKAGHHAPVATGLLCKSQITNMNTGPARPCPALVSSQGREQRVPPLSSRLQTWIAYGDKRKC